MLTIFLAQFEWYRKRKGGKWYKAIQNSNEAGFQAPVIWWTQNPAAYKDIEILKDENWPLKYQRDGTRGSKS